MNVVLPKEVREEVNMWKGLLEVLCNGMARPNDISHYMYTLEKLESNGFNVDELRKCCLTDGTIREAKDFKGHIFAILERIEKLTHLEVRIERRKYDRF